MEKRYIPFGYRVENGKKVINKEEASVVRRIYEMRIKGEGVSAIGKQLYDERQPFFSDTKDKSIKKVSAILYKKIYAGDKNYPAIVDAESFSCIGRMKDKPIRRHCANDEGNVEYTENMNFEYKGSDEISNIEMSVSEMIRNRKAESKEVLEMILKLASKKYSCIIQKEED